MFSAYWERKKIKSIVLSSSAAIYLVRERGDGQETLTVTPAVQGYVIIISYL